MTNNHDIDIKTRCPYCGQHIELHHRVHDKEINYPKNSEEIKERIKGKGLRNIPDGEILNKGIKNFIGKRDS